MPLRWPRFWRQPLKAVRIVVYTRRNCPLCDEAAHFLEAERSQLGFALDYIDVDTDPALREQHGNWVPVVEVAGKVRFRGHIQPMLWRRLVTALQRLR